jgi:hypothetical protein
MAKKDIVVPLSRFRRRGAAEVVPEIDEAPMPAIDRSGRSKIRCPLSSNGSGKTTYARWLNFHAFERGNEPPLLAALDPSNRGLVSWFGGVERSPNRDTKDTAYAVRRWLALMDQRRGFSADPDSQTDFPSHVREVQERLAKGIARAGLTGNAYAKVIGALSETLSVLPAFVEEVSGQSGQGTMGSR